MVFSKLSPRSGRRFLLLEFNPHQVLAAVIRRPQHGFVVVESSAEFARDDEAGLLSWLEGDADGRKMWLPAFCGLVPRRAILQRQTLEPRRLREPDYVMGVVEEHQRGQFLTATPFKIVDRQEWTLRAVNAVDGGAVPPDGPAHPLLICGIANAEVHEVQQQLFDHRCTLERLEPGLLSLFGSMYAYLERKADSRALVIAVVHDTATAVYILGKDGVYTPNPVLYGFDSIVELARKELGLKDEAEVRRQLETGEPVLLQHAAKLVRRIGRDLKPVVDSFEMETGQPVEEIFCPYLPANLRWIAEPLALVTGRTAMVVETDEWLAAAKIHLVDESSAAASPHWLGALSLIANLAPATAETSRANATAASMYSRPWHVDCGLRPEGSEHRFTRRRIVGSTIATVALLLAVAFTAWQSYATRALRADTAFWERQMADNRKLFDQLATASAQLKADTRTLKYAHDLMSSPFQLSDFVLTLGRTIPPRMRVMKIETAEAHVAISGTVLEPAEEASATLGRYMEELRRNPGVGPLFSSIMITSLQRKIDSDAVVFEITLRLYRPAVLP